MMEGDLLEDEDLAWEVARSSIDRMKSFFGPYDVSRSP
jgi:hypothetical protein